MLIALMGAFGWLPESVVTPLLRVLSTLPHTPSFYQCREENWRFAVTHGAVGHHLCARHHVAPEILVRTILWSLPVRH